MRVYHQEICQRCQEILARSSICFFLSKILPWWIWMLISSLFFIGNSFASTSANESVDCCHSSKKTKSPSVALFYGAQAPLDIFRVFDIVVVEPAHGYDPKAYEAADTSLYAYISVAEVHPTRQYFKDIPEAWKLSRNGDWDSVVLDQTPEQWPEFFSSRIVAPLWEKGYRGFFLDTLDSYRLANNFDEVAQQAGLVRVIQTLNERFPDIRLIINRGFEILPKIHHQVQMVAGESLFKSWNAKEKIYEDVSESNRQWLQDQLINARDKYGLHVLSIDYVPALQRSQARETAERIRKLGIIPWVTDHQLESIGIGTVEPIPRRILVIYNGAVASTIRHTDVHRYLQLPLNYMGYMADYVDVQEDMPEQVTPDRYAGVVIWLSSHAEAAKAQKLSQWMQQRVAQQMPMAVFGSLGFEAPPVWIRLMGGQPSNSDPQGPTKLVQSDPIMGFESPVIAAGNNYEMFSWNEDRAPDGFEPLVLLQDARQQIFVMGGITAWGGYIQNPYAVDYLPGIQEVRWIIDPFKFLKRSLRLQAIPVPDTTTENGLRFLTAHIDGDGFPSRAELAGSPLAAKVLLEQILQRYRFPHTMSVIEAEVAPHGLHPEMSVELESIAKQMFALPHVEIASHSYSHPYIWDPSRLISKDDEVSEVALNLDVPNYKMDLHREIVGSVDYIRKRLAPEGKAVNVMLWSGDTSPNAQALAITQQAGLLNMNGGDTSITLSQNSLTFVGSFGIEKEGVLQVYAPITNENIYTNLWTGPFYGFARVIESFELTGSPRRLKPVGIYYHTYATSKPASIHALHQVYGWTARQPLHSIHASEFIRKVQDFFSTSIARTPTGWRVRSRGDLRTIRWPDDLPMPHITPSSGLVGTAPGPDGRYLHMASVRADIDIQPIANGYTPSMPQLVTANARLHRWSVSSDGKQVQMQLKGYQPLRLSLAHVQDCKLRGLPAKTPTRGTLKRAQPPSSSTLTFDLAHAQADIEIDCR